MLPRHRASLVAQMVKCLPAMRETRVRSLGQEDPLEKEMATHSSILAWKIPWTEETDGLQSMGSQRVQHDWATSLSFFSFLPFLRQGAMDPIPSRGTTIPQLCPTSHVAQHTHMHTHTRTEEISDDSKVAHVNLSPWGAIIKGKKKLKKVLGKLWFSLNVLLLGF